MIFHNILIINLYEVYSISTNLYFIYISVRWGR